MELNLIFPHQLFLNHPIDLSNGITLLIEEELFLNQYKFHKQKIAFHRASMKAYLELLVSKGIKCEYINAKDEDSDIRRLIQNRAAKTTKVHYVDPCDYLLNRRLKREGNKAGIELVEYPSPSFLNGPGDLEYFNPVKKKFFQSKFYSNQRKKFGILIDGNGQPIGGKWSFDADNRKKYPKDKVAPTVIFPKNDKHFDESVLYVQKYFQTNPGDLSKKLYPINHIEAEQWFDQFLKTRFSEFGPYEDAIVKEEIYLEHSVLSPLLNSGLLEPKYAVNRILEFANENDIPLNSTEGLIRQIIGWREFIRGVYVSKGVEERNRNFWGFERKIPGSFYIGETGIDPVDDSIKKVLKTGYCHHIERLMILGNFMLLCAFDPDEVYRWFMELFIDAYDWVMVPNVYGMSQFADGGLMSTKPYISGSNYILKMSNYKKGDWQVIWDALFWRFMHINRAFLSKNPRLNMLIRSLDRMAVEKRNLHFETADDYLKSLDQRK